MPRGKTADSQISVLVNKIVHMLPGQSFFIADATSADVAFLRRPVMAAGCNLKIVQVESDEIYCVHGVRIWREEGEFDDL